MEKILERNLPIPRIAERELNQNIYHAGISFGLHPVIARVLAARQLPPEFTIEQILAPKLTQLLPPQSMADMDKAALRVANAIMHGEIIGIETDHDCDGQTSHAVLYHNLVNRFLHPAQKIRSYIGHRLTEGYGLSEPVAARILADDPRPSLIITADNGSSDELRIAKLQANGIEVIVTDHHEIPKEGYPKSAFACLNPIREDCDYPDPYIAGCMVAWLLMAATRKKLIESDYLPLDAKNLSDSLDFVAVGTVADCVSIARSQNNRAIISYGLKLIEAGTRPCWRALKTLLNGPVRSEDLGFKIGPLLNSDGRLSSAFGSVSFLLSETDEEAHEWIVALQDQNEQRKKIQRSILAMAIEKAHIQVAEEKTSLCIYLEEGHPGVQGIAASRLKDAFGRPVVIFAIKQAGKHAGADDDLLITGSARGIENFHVRDSLQWVANEYPNMMIAFGGHKGAGGLTLRLKDFELFQSAFEQACLHQIKSQKIKSQANIYLGPVIWTDGEIDKQNLNLNFLDQLSTLEPFGREFEPPVFELSAKLIEIKSVGDGTHAKITIEKDRTRYKGIWFGMRSGSHSPMPVKAGDEVKLVFTLRDNYFRGQRNFDIQVLHMHVI